VHQHRAEKQEQMVPHFVTRPVSCCVRCFFFIIFRLLKTVLVSRSSECMVHCVARQAQTFLWVVLTLFFFLFVYHVLHVLFLLFYFLIGRVGGIFGY